MVEWTPLYSGDAASGWERRQAWGVGTGVLHWGDWKPCTEADARRVTGLRTWEVRRIAPATETAPTNDSGDAAISMRDEVEEFAQGFDGCMVDGVGGEIDVGEAIRTWARQRDALARLGTPATSLTHAARAQSRIDQFIFKWICSEYEFNTDDFKQAKRDFLEAAYTEGRADQREEAGEDARGVKGSHDAQG
jgi:hypothetical protein